jgi:PST family polysaccharide transporter
LLAEKVLQDAAAASDIGWLAIAVALIVAAASQGALLNGMRRVGDLARVSVGSALLSTAIGTYALWMWGGSGIVAFVVAGPLASFVFGHWYVSRLPRPQGRSGLRAMSREWSTLARLGFAFMVAGLAGTVGQLVVRVLVQRDLGVEALGHFHAAWAISMTYIGFVLGAMGTDYYPRLVAVVGDPAAVNRLVNEQVEVALLLAAPILLVMLGLAPWVIEALYSSLFNDAVEILRWQVLGDVLKIASWPLGYILVASGAGKTFMAVEWLAMGAFVALTFALLPAVGLLATGISFLAMYALLLAVVWGLARWRTGFRFSNNSLYLLAGVVAASGIVMAMTHYSSLAAAIASVVGAAAFAVYALARLAQASSAGGRVGRVAVWLRDALKKVGAWRD